MFPLLPHNGRQGFESQLLKREVTLFVSHDKEFGESLRLVMIEVSPILKVLAMQRFGDLTR